MSSLYNSCTRESPWFNLESRERHRQKAMLWRPVVHSWDFCFFSSMPFCLSFARCRCFHLLLDSTDPWSLTSSQFHSSPPSQPKHQAQPKMARSYYQGVDSEYFNSLKARLSIKSRRFWFWIITIFPILWLFVSLQFANSSYFISYPRNCAGHQRAGAANHKRLPA